MVRTNTLIHLDTPYCIIMLNDYDTLICMRQVLCTFSTHTIQCRRQEFCKGGSVFGNLLLLKNPRPLFAS